MVDSARSVIGGRPARGRREPLASGSAVCPADEAWMRQALALARRACQQGEVPVGAVLVRQQVVLAKACNGPIGACDPTAHAEVLAVRAAAARIGNYRLTGTTLYVTLEPCPMCVGALVHARVSRVVFGAHDPKSGAAGGATDLTQCAAFNHRIAFSGGVLGEPCAALLRAFFEARRSGAR